MSIPEFSDPKILCTARDFISTKLGIPQEEVARLINIINMDSVKKIKQAITAINEIILPKDDTPDEMVKTITSTPLILIKINEYLINWISSAKDLPNCNNILIPLLNNIKEQISGLINDKIKELKEAK